MNRTNTATTPLVLVVEDETELSDILLAYLQRDNLRTLHAATGPDALRLFREHQPSIVLLDIRLPGKDGVDVLKEIRQENDTPVIMTTALADDLDKMLSLRLGADDYVVKPYNPAEVIERVRAVLRRTFRAAEPRTDAPLRIGQLEIDQQAYTARAFDAEERPVVLPLTLTEFRILVCLAKRPKRCFSRAELIEACLPESDALDRVIDSHLSKLRKKLQDAGCNDLIETVRGIGYRLWRDS